jgi:spermidine synthase
MRVMKWLHAESRLALGLVCVVLACMAPLAQAQQLKLVHSERSLYRQVLVYEQGGLRYLCFTKDCAIGRQSVIDLEHPETLQFDYTHMMMSALFAVPAPKSVLIVGLGGGTLPRTLAGVLPTTHIDTVEIDPAVTRVARSYFSYVPSPNTSTFEEDGRAYVKRMIRARKTYDLVMLDAYDHEYIPEHLLTREFLQEVKSLLNPGGIVAANTFSSSKLYDSESVTYRAVFGEFYNLKSGNRVIIASNGPLPPLTTLRRNSTDFASRFAKLGFEVEDILDRYSLQPDWNAGARILTDQYSPANLLNSTR